MLAVGRPSIDPRALASPPRLSRMRCAVPVLTPAHDAILSETSASGGGGAPRSTPLGAISRLLKDEAEEHGHWD
jgi:hypothetical protein